jgi:hypothetical protein
MFERNEESPRWAHSQGRFAQKLNDHGADPLALEFGCDQTHGLVTEWSDGSEQSNVDCVCSEEASSFRSGSSAESASSEDRAHEGEMPVIHGSDLTGRSEFFGAVEWKREIWVRAEA